MIIHRVPTALLNDMDCFLCQIFNVICELHLESAYYGRLFHSLDKKNPCFSE